MTSEITDDGVLPGIAVVAIAVLGGSDQRMEMSVPVDTFSVEPSTSVRRVIAFELRSQQWLTTTALQSGVVQDDALQAAVTATTRAEGR
jgi:hypothetical protein